MFIILIAFLLFFGVATLVPEAGFVGSFGASIGICYYFPVNQAGS